MKTAEDFLRQYAKGKPLELFIRDGGGELANNSRHIADVMEAYKEHCTKAENLPISDVRISSIGDVFKIFITKIENGVIFSIYDEHGLLVSNVADSKEFINGLQKLIADEA